MSAVAGLDKLNVRVGEDEGAGLGREADEGIVCGREDERGHRDLVDDAGAGGAVVIVVGGAEIAISGNDLLIELANGTDGADAI